MNPRSQAARKAAATRAARKAQGVNGAPAAPHRPRKGKIFATPAPNYHGLKLAALAALEDLFVIKVRDHGVSDDLRRAYDRYNKLKALALNPHATTTEMQNEAASALRLATVELVKLAF